MASVTAKANSAKVTKGKKASAPKVPRAHPPYVEMITDVIVAMKERTGSSQYAIAKFIEEKQKAHLPPNFKKLLLVQLKKLVASEKLVKVKNSFKLSSAAKPVSAAVKKAPAAAATVKVPVKKTVVVKAKAKAVGGAKVVGGAKAKGVTPVKTKKVAPKPKAVSKPKKAAKTATVKSPGKKVASKKGRK
ncbi:histone H1-like [Camellia sinensis]|uniref:histone H1-like n=1 Tax=Camellia sinensis TaxID=4442 RepID=UPI001035728E|nr:histone H1-like [Camellia sinensis]